MMDYHGDFVRKEICEHTRNSIEDKFKVVHHRIDELKDLVNVVKQQGEAIIELTTELKESRKDIDEVKREMDTLAKEVARKEDFDNINQALAKFIEQPINTYRELKVGIAVAAVSAIITWIIARL